VAEEQVCMCRHITAVMICEVKVLLC
jgi:hypothetical protein